MRGKDPVSNIYLHSNSTDRDKGAFLPNDAYPKITESSQLSSMESHQKSVQIPPEVLPLCEARLKGRPRSLRLLQQASLVKMHRLPWKPQPNV